MFEMDTQALLHAYGYYTILGWTFLEGETVVIIAGALAQQGYLDPLLIALCAFCGSCASDQLMFLLGKYKGPAVLARFPRLARNAAKAEALIHKYETGIILGFRFVYGVRNVTPVMLGIHRVSHLKFLALNVVGAAVWAAAFTAGGYFFGKIFTVFIEQANRAVICLLAALACGIGIWYLRQRARARTGPPPAA